MMSGANASCRDCEHFDNAPGSLEAALPGVSSLSSAYAAVRSDDGVCAMHARYVAASSICGAHVARYYSAAISTRQS
jgi:hypothetical protein